MNQLTRRIRNRTNLIKIHQIIQILFQNISLNKLPLVYKVQESLVYLINQDQNNMLKLRI